MKKAVLIVSFGTTHIDTRAKTIDIIKEKIEANFKEHTIRMAYSANQIIKKLKQRDGVDIDTPIEALDRLKEDGYEDVIIQPLHIIPGEEFDYIKAISDYYNRKGVFKRLTLGRPALYFQGGSNTPDDYEIFINALKEDLDLTKTYILMGHGTTHYANACYLALQQVLINNGYNNIFISNVEGYPEIDVTIKKLIERNINEVTLKPLMLVSGDHAKNDMASSDDDSWKSILERENIKVNLDMKSLGEIDSFQNIYVNHAKDADKEIYIEAGVSKKIPKEFL